MVASLRFKFVSFFSLLLVLSQLTSLQLFETTSFFSFSFPQSTVANEVVVPAIVFQANKPQQQQGFFSISGTLINLSGGQIDLNSDVMLTVYNNGIVQEVLSAPLLANQTFIFHLVPYSSDWSYVASFIHNNIEYRSQVINGYNYASAGTAPVTIWVYDSTSDNSLIRGEGMHVTLAFKEQGFVHVVESMMFVNPSSLVITPVSSNTPVIFFELDGQARNLAFIDEMNSGIYRLVPGGFGDWQPILPGSVHQVMFEYDLPFDGKEEIIVSLPMRMNSIVVMMEDQDDNVTCSGSQLNFTSNSPTGFVELFKGVPSGNDTEVLIHCVRKWRVLPMVIAGLSLVLVGLSLFVGIKYYKEKRKKVKALDRENQHTQILDAIIALDDQYKAGQIPNESYSVKRAELIKKLEE